MPFKDPEKRRAYFKQWKQTPEAKKRAVALAAKKYDEDPEFRARHQAASRNCKLKREYGISAEEYDNLFRLQNGCCAICGGAQSLFKRRLAVDHDHKTNMVRGLLCGDCNRAMGLLKDDVAAIERAAKYIRSNQRIAIE